MGFVEGLRQQEIARARAEQLRARLRAAQIEEELQREVAEKERRAKRREQAEAFRKESRVGAVVAELGEFLARPTVPYLTNVDYADGGGHYEETRYRGRGSSAGPIPEVDLPVSRKDPDSVFDLVRWDSVYLSGNEVTNKLYEATHHFEKYIPVETCPNGTIVFHGDWLESTTISVEKWRGKDKEQIFDKALKRAYEHPMIKRQPYRQEYYPFTS